MNLYFISQAVNNGYDTYDSAVVAAANEHDAARISPDHFYEWRDEGGWHFVPLNGQARAEGARGDWAMPSQVKVEFIGVAADGITGVVCASFNAG